MLLTMLLSSCAALIGPRDVEFPLSKMHQSLDKRLPFSQRYMTLFDVTASQAKLTLPLGQDRLSIDTDVTVALPLLGKSWSGKMQISGVLALDNLHNAVILTAPRLGQLGFQGVDKNYAAQVAQIGNFLAAQMLDKVPLYTFKPEDLRYAGVTFMPTKIGTKPESLVITFEPVK
jgi:hypothetical protein